MNQRGEYGRGGSPGERAVRIRYVPVLDVVVGPEGHRSVATTSRVALWDPGVERVCGSGPSYYAERDGGWWYFHHPGGEMWLEGRRYRPWKSRVPAAVYEADPALRVAGWY